MLQTEEDAGLAAYRADFDGCFTAIYIDLCKDLDDFAHIKSIEDEYGKTNAVRFGFQQQIDTCVLALCYGYVVATTRMNHVSTVGFLVSRTQRRQGTLARAIKQTCVDGLNASCGPHAADVVRMIRVEMRRGEDSICI